MSIAKQNTLNSHNLKYPQIDKLLSKEFVVRSVSSNLSFDIGVLS